MDIYLWRGWGWGGTTEPTIEAFADSGRPQNLSTEASKMGSCASLGGGLGQVHVESGFPFQIIEGSLFILMIWMHVGSGAFPPYLGFEERTNQGASGESRSLETLTPDCVSLDGSSHALSFCFFG